MYSKDNLADIINEKFEELRKSVLESEKWITIPNFFPLPFDDVLFPECLHNQCPECHGSGIKSTGGACFHNLSCSCPKCSPR